MDMGEFGKLPLLGILRGVKPEAIGPVVDLCREAGLRTIEVAMNTPGAPELIRQLAARGREAGLTVGAGTVMSPELLQQALDAGAEFIVLPVVADEVIRRCVRQKIPVFPGALTPLEIHRAWTAGAAMVKVFPAQVFGPAYFKAVKGPFDELKLLACGGVTPETLAAYFDAGADAAAFGGSVFSARLLAAGEYGEVGERLKRLVGAYREWRGE